MTFKRAFDLNNNVIRMGPLTLATVDSGYSAVTEDNGEQKASAAAFFPSSSKYLRARGDAEADRVRAAGHRIAAPRSRRDPAESSHLGHISGISRAYLGHISGIYLGTDEQRVRDIPRAHVRVLRRTGLPLLHPAAHLREAGDDEDADAARLGRGLREGHVG